MVGVPIYRFPSAQMLYKQWLVEIAPGSRLSTAHKINFLNIFCYFSPQYNQFITISILKSRFFIIKKR